MTDRKLDRRYAWYTCGQCGHEIYRLKTESDIIPCPECSWEHRAKKKYDIPSKVKLDLAQ